MIDWDLWCIDGPSVRAARSAAGASKGVRTKRERLPSEAAGDNGDSYPRVRLWMARRGSHPVMPQRGDRAMRDSDLGLAPTGPSSLVLAAGRPCGRASPSLWVGQLNAVLLGHDRHCLQDSQTHVSRNRAAHHFHRDSTRDGPTRSTIPSPLNRPRCDRSTHQHSEICPNYARNDIPARTPRRSASASATPPRWPTARDLRGRNPCRKTPHARRETRAPRPCGRGAQSEPVGAQVSHAPE